MRVAVVHNPYAGGGTLEACDIRAMLRASGHELAAYASMADPSWRDALYASADAVIAAGGDGTVRKVFTALAGSPRLVAILPSGTANNVARSLGLSTSDHLSSMAAWDPDRPQRFDLPAVTLDGTQGRFVESVGGGCLAELLLRAETMRVESGTPSAIDALREIVVRAPVGHWTIELDGRDHSGWYLGVEALQSRRIGPGILLHDMADPGDRMVTLVLIAPFDRAGFDRFLAGHGAEAEPPLFDVHHGHELRLRPPAGHVLHIDDDPVPGHERTTTMPIHVTTDDVHLDVLVESAG